MVVDPRAKVLETLDTVSAIVGATLGPGGRTVLLERQEHGLPPFLTKDGVTVYRALGFNDPVKDAIMEVMRDPAVRTASEAGDGTTTATILAAALYRETSKFCEKNPGVAPQFVMRHLMGVIQDEGIPFLEGRAVAATLETVEGKAMLRAVAKVSANGDSALADAVVQTMEIAGDLGNVVITEGNGRSEYRSEKIPGYSLTSGWEDTMRSLWPNWITDQGNQRCVVERPRVLVVNGRLSMFSIVKPVLERVAAEWDAMESGNAERLLSVAVAEGILTPVLCGSVIRMGGPKCTGTLVFDGQAWKCSAKGCSKEFRDLIPNMTPAQHEAFRKYQENLNRNVVIVANGFSDGVLTDFFGNFMNPDGLKLVPVLAPHGPTVGFQGQILSDIAAIAGSRVLDPVSISTGKFSLADLGPGILGFEMSRLSCTFVGVGHEQAVDDVSKARLRQQLSGRVSDVMRQEQAAASIMDKGHILERKAKLTGGLAQLTVVGASNGEVRERRDRAEDAICATRGAMRSGCLPGGCWGLVAMGWHLRSLIKDNGTNGISIEDRCVLEIVWPALLEPLRRLLTNAGVVNVQSLMDDIIRRVEDHLFGGDRNDIHSIPPVVAYDLTSRSFVDPYRGGLLDSAPAVIEAVRSAASIGLKLGEMGPIVVYARDAEFERAEAAAAASYDHAVNEANERA